MGLQAATALWALQLLVVGWGLPRPAPEAKATLPEAESLQEPEPVPLAAPPPMRPNLVWFLTDDQDQMLGASFPPLGAATPMPKTRRLMQEGGAHATRWYIHTPICSPSRSELLTGRYFHNIKEVGPKAVMHVNYTEVYANSFVRTLQEEAGYATGLFGKYVNEMPQSAPPGFDAWLANDGGDYVAPSFHAQGIDGLPDGEVHFTSAPSNYSTAVVGNVSVAWIRKVAGQGKPFIAYIAPKAAHEPFNPAPWYAEHWDSSWPEREPRSPNWNCSAESRRHHHGNIASERLISDQASKIITGVFKNRWRTLMSVDDVIAEVHRTVEELGLLQSTYFFYSSDHGFQLGQFNILMDKRHVYEWDTKIHLLASGPGITPGSSFDVPGMQVDIAPTLLGLAGLDARGKLDGKSIVPFLVDGGSPELLPSTRTHLQQLGDAGAYRRAWRQEVFIEYYYCDDNVKCTGGCEPGNWPHEDSNCVDLANNDDCWCNYRAGMADCYATEDKMNNFIALRRLSEDEDLLYSEFQAGDLESAAIDFGNVSFVEFFDVRADPWQMRNLAADPSTEPKRDELHRRLRVWLGCSGPTCP